MTPTWRRRLKLAIAGLLAAAAVAIPALQPADAQTPPVVERLVIVNEDEEKPFVERKKNGEFRARPIFNLRLSQLTYGIRDADDLLRDYPRAPAGRHLQQDSGRAQP